MRISPSLCHSRAGGNPDSLWLNMDSRLRGNDRNFCFLKFSFFSYNPASSAGELQPSVLIELSSIFCIICVMNNKEKLGHIHPLTKVIRKINDVFSEMGFNLIDGRKLKRNITILTRLIFLKITPREICGTHFGFAKMKSKIKNQKSKSKKINYCFARTLLPSRFVIWKITNLL